jgi:hypothetical protein
MEPEKPKPKMLIAILILVMAALLGMAAFIFYLWRDKTSDILAHKGFTKGRIITYYHARKSSAYVFEYGYSIKDSNYIAEQNVPIGAIKDSFLGKTFPVIYDTTAAHSTYYPFAAYLLITPADFKKFNMAFPDSLHWVLKHINL